MKKTKEQKYELKREGAVEYVVVRCPDGHLNRGQKVNDMKLCVELVCAMPHCGLLWTETILAILYLEAVP
jgi:hypothetical protein